jgi:hypothetical protein
LLLFGTLVPGSKMDVDVVATVVVAFVDNGEDEECFSFSSVPFFPVSSPVALVFEALFMVMATLLKIFLPRLQRTMVQRPQSILWLSSSSDDKIQLFRTYNSTDPPCR